MAVNPRYSDYRLEEHYDISEKEKFRMNMHLARTFEKKIDEDKYADLFMDETQSDVTFLVGPKRWTIPGHKEALSSACWIFNVALCLLKLDKDEIIIEDVKLNDFLLFLELLYKGNIRVDIAIAWDLLKLAYRFDVVYIINMCELFLGEELKFKNCCYYYERDTFLKEDSELKKFYSFMLHKWNNSLLINELKNIPLGMMIRILQSENLNYTEIKLFKILLNWAKETCKKEAIPIDSRNLRRIMGDAFYEIRFPTMSIESFNNILEDFSSLFTTEEISMIIKCIKGKKESCGKFKNNFRSYCKLYQSICEVERKVRELKEIFSQDDKKRLFCIYTDISLTGCTNLFLYFKFRSECSRNLLGYGFYSEDEGNLIALCTHVVLDSDVGRKLNIKCKISPKKHNDNGYFYREVYFNERIQIEPNSLYTLYLSKYSNLEYLSKLCHEPIEETCYNADLKIKHFMCYSLDYYRYDYLLPAHCLIFDR
ncbi:BTB/POZ domain-containing protein 3-like [Lutzomyia longipalpis]|uniref:BTB/POZ domain-containing protein 3-like n=1 Tax=Lutzomyia longipalpis TaxID=7200 RepID=UPI0024833A80|nr:BTB/POZ domain-containing protein 3-like [Lutzomyia longipalpis]